MTHQTPNLKLPLLLLLAPAALLPLRMMLSRQALPHLLFGLSSDFYAGVTIGISLASAAIGLALLVRALTTEQA